MRLRTFITAVSLGLAAFGSTCAQRGFRGFSARKT